MAEQQPQSDIAEMSFETALKELESIVEALEQGEVPLDKSIEYYERGEALQNHCKSLLKAAEDKIEKIRLGPDGKPNGTEPLDS